MGQIAYAWHDSDLSAFKIGKTDDEKRFLQRCREALGSNPRIELIAAWETNLEKPIDAGERLASTFNREAFGTGAREWFRAPNVEAVLQRGNDLFGSPICISVPESIREHAPWDPFGNMPKGGEGASRVWVHRELRIAGLLKVSDNSWWAPNLKTTWNNTFNPTGFEVVAAYEWPQLSDQGEQWSQLNQQTRHIKFEAQRVMGRDGLAPIAEIGWLGCSEEDARRFLRDAGLTEFDPREGHRAGICGQGEHFRCRCGR